MPDIATPFVWPEQERQITAEELADIIAKGEEAYRRYQRREGRVPRIDSPKPSWPRSRRVTPEQLAEMMKQVEETIRRWREQQGK